MEEFEDLDDKIEELIIDEEQLIMNANSDVNSNFVIEAMKKDRIPKIY